MLHAFDIASPELIAARSLQERVDTKFMLPRERIESLLARLSATHEIISAGGDLRARYSSTYFDTDDFETVSQHLRGVRPRFKVRSREHLSRGLAFLEVKRRAHADMTEKSRLERPPAGALEFTETESEFVRAHSPFDPALLRSRLETRFSRITLVGVEDEERLTIDEDLCFAAATPERASSQKGSGEKTLPEIAVIEIKQARFAARSTAFLALRAERARRVSFSKYCMGASLLLDVPGRTQWLAKLRSMLRE